MLDEFNMFGRVLAGTQKPIVIATQLQRLGMLNYHTQQTRLGPLYSQILYYPIAPLSSHSQTNLASIYKISFITGRYRAT